MRIRGRLRSLATACYPPVVPDLRIEDQGRIRGPGHEGVALVDVAVVLALAPLPVRGQEVESVDAGHRPRRALLVPARGVEALGLDVTGLDPRIDTGHAVTALGVNGRGLLTSTGRAVSVRVPLPAGEIGVAARGHMLSRIACVTARGQAGYYLAPLPASGRRRQDGWPDEKPRRVLGRLPRSLLWFLKRRRLSLLLLPSAVQDLARFFLSLSGSSSLGAIGGIVGVTASAAGSGGAVCPSTAAGGAVTTCATAVAPD